MAHPNALEHPVSTAVPSWVRDAIFYQIFPDRFAISKAISKPKNLESWDSPPTPNGFKGGDLIGVAEKIPYLLDLGINAIYLTPIFSSTANHRYHTFDYFSVDPILGGNDALRQLIDTAHSSGMKVVLDGVFNHASRGFFQFNHVLENGRFSPYRDWFHFNPEWLAKERMINAYPNPLQLKPGKQPAPGMDAFGYDCWWNLPALPKFNTNNPEVREFIFSVAEHWLRFGIDGWRLDVPNEIDDDSFWQEFRIRAKKINPEAYIVGEIWSDAERWLQGDQFDAVMNYELGSAILRWSMSKVPPEDITQAHSYSNLSPISDEEFAARLKKMTTSFSLDITLSQMNMLGSHDTPRTSSMLSAEVDAISLAVGLQFCLPGSPCIYYGDEIAMPGGHDPDCRRTFPQGPTPSHLTPLGEQIHATYRNLAILRKQERTLREGRTEIVSSTNNVVVVRRSAHDEQCLVVANRSREPQTLLLPSAKRVVFGPAVVQGDTVKLPPRSLTLLRE